VGLGLLFRRATSGSGGERAEAWSALGDWLPGALGLGLAAFGIGSVLAALGVLDPATVARGLVLAAPGPLPGWLLLPGVALALVSGLSASGPLRGREALLGLALVATLLVVAVPSARALAPVATFTVALLAGEGFVLAARPARVAAACLCVPVVFWALSAGAGGTATSPAEDELVGFTENSPGERVEGWLHPTVSRVVGVQVVLARVSEYGGPEPGGLLYVPATLDAEPAELAPGAPVAGRGEAPGGARWFRAELPLDELEAGTWHVRVEFTEEPGAADDPVLGQRYAGRLVVGAGRERLLDGVALLAVLALLFGLLCRSAGRGSAGVLLAAALLQAAVCSVRLIE